MRSDEAIDLVERAPGSQSDTVVDTEKMPASRVSKYKEIYVLRKCARKEFQRLCYVKHICNDA